MITAMQSAKLRAANALLKAREEVLSTRSLICWPDGRFTEVDVIVEKIDALFEKVIPNSKAKP